MLEGMRDKLMAAASQGIISTEQADRLCLFLETPPHSVRNGLDALRDDDPPAPVEESEMPRFVRGFHDVLITIGVVILLIGMAGLTHVAVALAVSLVLAEVLVKRQRLALPAVALTIAYLVSATFLILEVANHVYQGRPDSEIGTAGFVLVGYLVLLVPFYWRYHVPLALASLIVGITGAATVLAIAVWDHLRFGSAVHIVETRPMLLFSLAASLFLFVVAMRFDLSDPRRITRRSDVAFWMHLATAPALLYSTLALLLSSRQMDGEFELEMLSSSQPLSVILVVVVFVLIGLVIDRRAFVTSGLISLGVAIGTLFQDRMINFDMRFSLVLAVVGMVVLGIGVFWPMLRRLIVGQLPAHLQSRLPPLRA